MIKIVNLESGMPSVSEATARLNQELLTARACRCKTVKLIHGYGSSGKGGAIKPEVHRYLNDKKRSGFIKEYVKGEDFTPFSASGRRAVDICPELSKDRDYSRGNDGITIVIL